MYAKAWFTIIVVERIIDESSNNIQRFSMIIVSFLCKHSLLFFANHFLFSCPHSCRDQQHYCLLILLYYQTSTKQIFCLWLPIQDLYLPVSIRITFPTQRHYCLLILLCYQTDINHTNLLPVAADTRFYLPVSRHVTFSIQQKVGGTM